MLQFSVIGNLGGDAEMHNDNGQQYVTFRVGHSNRRTDAQGNQVDETIWVSCILNGDGGKLLNYLKKGQKVFVTGDGSVRTYHSEKMRRLIAGCNIFVRSIELVGAKPDVVPSALFDSDGVQVNIRKYYYAGAHPGNVLFDRNGTPFLLDDKGWVTPPVSYVAPNEDNVSATDDSAMSQHSTGNSATNQVDNVQQGGSSAATNSADMVFDGQGYSTVGEAQGNMKNTTKRKAK